MASHPLSKPLSGQALRSWAELEQEGNSAALQELIRAEVSARVRAELAAFRAELAMLEAVSEQQTRIIGGVMLAASMWIAWRYGVR